MNKGLKYAGGKICAIGVRFVLTVATINAAFWNVMLHALVELNRHFQESSQWGQEDPLKCQYIFTRLNNITSQQTVILIDQASCEYKTSARQTSLSSVLPTILTLSTQPFEVQFFASAGGPFNSNAHCGASFSLLDDNNVHLMEQQYPIYLLQVNTIFPAL
jgi:hypothetical protein